jgi:very-short-patch-repair endonuclease
VCAGPRRGIWPMKEKYQYKSDMKELLKCYLSQKQMAGFKFERQKRELERFDDY